MSTIPHVREKKGGPRGGLGAIRASCPQTRTVIYFAVPIVPISRLSAPRVGVNGNYAELGVDSAPCGGSSAAPATKSEAGWRGSPRPPGSLHPFEPLAKPPSAISGTGWMLGWWAMRPSPVATNGIEASPGQEGALRNGCEVTSCHEREQGGSPGTLSRHPPLPPPPPCRGRGRQSSGCYVAHWQQLTRPSVP